MSSFNQSTNQELRIEEFSPFGGFATWILSVKRLSFRFEYPFDDGLTGLFGAVATFAEYSTNANVLAVAAGQPIQPWKLPENIKPPLQTGVESAAELKQFDRNMADWDRRSKMITAIRLDYRNFLSAMMLSIPRYNRSQLIAENNGEDDITPQVIVSEMRRRYPPDLTATVRECRVDLLSNIITSDRSLPEHFALHFAAHRNLANAGSLMSEFDKIENCISTISRSGLHLAAIDQYYKQPMAQNIMTQSFDLITTFMLTQPTEKLAIRSSHNSRLTTASRAFALEDNFESDSDESMSDAIAAVFSGSTPPSADVTAAVKQLIRLEASKAVKAIKPQRKDKSSTTSKVAVAKASGSATGKGGSRARQYCFTHGYDGHTGHNCRNPKAGHRPGDTKHGAAGSNDWRA
jgi:hypothetical protein